MYPKPTKYDAKADIFSIGCILFEIITGRRRFLKPLPNGPKLGFLIEPEEYPKYFEFQNVKDLINGCLQVDPINRYDMKQLKNSTFFQYYENLYSDLLKNMKDVAELEDIDLERQMTDSTQSEADSTFVDIDLSTQGPIPIKDGDRYVVFEGKRYPMLQKLHTNEQFLLEMEKLCE